MKSKILLNVVEENPQWTEAVDFDAVKVAEELKDLAFEYVAEVAKHPLLIKDMAYAVNVCLSDDEAVQKLNREFRGMDKPTNVLSFANIDDDEFWDALDDMEDAELGDIILAFETLQREAETKHISVYAHYCHLLVHGFCTFWVLTIRMIKRLKKWKDWKRKFWRSSQLMTRIRKRKRSDDWQTLFATVLFEFQA